MPQCVGTTATKGARCRMGATYHCPRCDAYLCSNHLVWGRDAEGEYTGPHCPWCKIGMEQRYNDGWAPWGLGRVKSVAKGMYRLGKAGEAYLKERDT